MGVWTSQEIQQLREYFLSGKSLKEMSNLLNRSMTAVNKSLTRFKIRQHTPLKIKPLLKFKVGENYYKSNKMRVRINYRMPPKCDMQEVYTFVERSMIKRLEFKNGWWYYHGFPIERDRAFILINLERELRKKPAFDFFN